MFGRKHYFEARLRDPQAFHRLMMWLVNQPDQGLDKLAHGWDVRVFYDVWNAEAIYVVNVPVHLLDKSDHSNVVRQIAFPENS